MNPKGIPKNQDDKKKCKDCKKYFHVIGIHQRARKSCYDCSPSTTEDEISMNIIPNGMKILSDVSIKRNMTPNEILKEALISVINKNPEKLNMIDSSNNDYTKTMKIKERKDFKKIYEKNGGRSKWNNMNNFIVEISNFYDENISSNEKMDSKLKTIKKELNDARILLGQQEEEIETLRKNQQIPSMVVSAKAPVFEKFKQYINIWEKCKKLVIEKKKDLDNFILKHKDELSFISSIIEDVIIEHEEKKRNEKQKEEEWKKQDERTKKRMKYELEASRDK